MKENKKKFQTKTYIALMCCSRSLGVIFKFPFVFVSYNQMMTVAIRATEKKIRLDDLNFFFFIFSSLTTQPSDEKYFEHKVTTIVDNHTRNHRYNGKPKILYRLTSRIRKIVFSFSEWKSTVKNFTFRKPFLVDTRE